MDHLVYELVQFNLSQFYWVPKNLNESVSMIFVETEAIFTKFCFSIEFVKHH